LAPSPLRPTTRDFFVTTLAVIVLMQIVADSQQEVLLKLEVGRRLATPYRKTSVCNEIFHREDNIKTNVKEIG
jgi:hypothetical protein